jgi:hypothetical protein
VEKSYAEFEGIARQMIAAYGARAPIAAAERLNECLDRGDQYGRDDWVQVIYEIYQLQRGMRPLGW